MDWQEKRLDQDKTEKGCRWVDDPSNLADMNKPVKELNAQNNAKNSIDIEKKDRFANFSLNDVEEEKAPPV